ncbi:MAG: winged helix-turn-helix transcriptional regulator [Candidatus Acidiferrum sp.]
MAGPDPLAFLWPAALCELRKKLPTISEQVLADQLRQLDGDGVLTRKVTVTNPPQVAYSLNAEDKKLVPLMETLCNWGGAPFGTKPNLPGHATRT